MEEDPGRGHYAKKLTEKEINKLEHERELSDYQRTKFEREAKKNWDLFYKRNTTHFFKDRHWITREFPELLRAISEVDDSHPVLLEVGCGVGNALFPLLEENDALFVHACDFSPRAIEFVKSRPEARCSAFVCDITEDPLSSRLGENSVDIALTIFVLSAISPHNMIPALKNIFQVLKPGGSLLFRDYGLYDHAMLRFGRGHKISENLYVRQDRTRAYFFSEGFTVHFASLKVYDKTECLDHTEKLAEVCTSAGFQVAENRYIQRETVNHKDSISVERIFIQGRFVKPISECTPKPLFDCTTHPQS